LTGVNVGVLVDMFVGVSVSVGMGVMVGVRLGLSIDGGAGEEGKVAVAVGVDGGSVAVGGLKVPTEAQAADKTTSNRVSKQKIILMSRL
jgi:hypothetical protein